MSAGHNLVASSIQRNGRFGTAWTCECGNWHPKPAAQSPFGTRAPMDTVVAYIQRLHGDHAVSAGAQDAAPDAGGAQP